MGVEENEETGPLSAKSPLQHDHPDQLDFNDGQPEDIVHLELERDTTPPNSPAAVGWQQRYAGLATTVLCSFFFSLTVLVAKLLQEKYKMHPFVISMWRYAGILVPAIPIALYVSVWTDVRVFETLQPLCKRRSMRNVGAYLLQGILGVTSTVFRFMSLQFIPLADSTVVISANSVFVTILAHFCLGEKCGIGVIIIARPPLISGKTEFNLNFVKGVSLALLALLCAGLFIILMRKIHKTHYALMMLVGGIWGVLECGVLAWTFGIFKWPTSLESWGLVCILMFVTFLAQSCFILGSPGPLSIARTSESVFAFLWQYALFGLIPDLISIVGGFLVLSAVVGTGYCQYLSSLPSQNPTRVRLNCLLK